MNRELIESVIKHEGYRDRAYQDSEGIWTIGYGTNLQELQIDQTLARKWMIDYLRDCEVYARRFPEFYVLDTEARRDVLIEMIYNMGPSRVAGFRNMLAAIRERNWEEAAAQMLDSKWHRQVGQRARTLADVMRKGHYG